MSRASCVVALIPRLNDLASRSLPPVFSSTAPLDRAVLLGVSHRFASRRNRLGSLRRSCAIEYFGISGSPCFYAVNCWRRHLVVYLPQLVWIFPRCLLLPSLFPHHLFFCQPRCPRGEVRNTNYKYPRLGFSLTTTLLAQQVFFLFCQKQLDLSLVLYPHIARYHYLNVSVPGFVLVF